MSGKLFHAMLLKATTIRYQTGRRRTSLNALAWLSVLQRGRSSTSSAAMSRRTPPVIRHQCVLSLSAPIIPRPTALLSTSSARWRRQASSSRHLLHLPLITTTTTTIIISSGSSSGNTVRERKLFLCSCYITPVSLRVRLFSPMFTLDGQSNCNINIISSPRNLLCSWPHFITSVI